MVRFRYQLLAQLAAARFSKHLLTFELSRGIVEWFHEGMHRFKRCAKGKLFDEMALHTRSKPRWRRRTRYARSNEVFLAAGGAARMDCWAKACIDPSPAVAHTPLCNMPEQEPAPALRAADRARVRRRQRTHAGACRQGSTVIPAIPIRLQPSA